MKILMINKYLYPRGGAENYMLRLGTHLQQGHKVQYFGMDHPNRAAGNRVNAYAPEVDLRTKNRWQQLRLGLCTIYSPTAVRRLRKVLEDFQPDVCHLNNFHYQLTPGMLMEIRRWLRKTNHPCKIVYTAHDYQLVCPNHLCRNGDRNCEKCLGGRFYHCVLGRCIQGSSGKSLIGTLEAYFWNLTGIYRELDRIVCCSQFLKEKLDTNPVLAEKTVVMHNFVLSVSLENTKKKEYVLYFGRYSREKGIVSLLEAAKELPWIPFVFAGNGELEGLLAGIPNVTNVGFQQGTALERLIREAVFTICPSECYENCPLSVMESIQLGTPVLGAAIGGIPELIQPGVTGELFESGNQEDLKKKILQLWQRPLDVQPGKNDFSSIEDYGRQLLALYGDTI